MDSNYQGRELQATLRANTLPELQRMLAELQEYAREQEMDEIELLKPPTRDVDGGFVSVITCHNLNVISWLSEKGHRAVLGAKEGWKTGKEKAAIKAQIAREAELARAPLEARAEAVEAAAKLEAKRKARLLGLEAETERKERKRELERQTKLARVEARARVSAAKFREREVTATQFVVSKEEQRRKKLLTPKLAPRLLFNTPSEPAGTPALGPISLEELMGYESPKEPHTPIRPKPPKELLKDILDTKLL